MAALAPVLYLPHGGGPLPLLADPSHQALIQCLKRLPESLPKPSAIVLISAHWEADKPTLNTAARPELLFDYYGFPPQAYEFSYPVSGDPALCREIQRLLEEHGITAGLDGGRGLDHGVFVPMMLLYPMADIPVVQLSLIKGLDPEAHIALGQALSSLREKGIMILGSGMSFHNLQAMFSGDREYTAHACEQFSQWLASKLINPELSDEQRIAHLSQWQNSPFADYCHPRAEHLIPLHVCLGAAQGGVATKIVDVSLMELNVAGYCWK